MRNDINNVSSHGFFSFFGRWWRHRNNRMSILIGNFFQCFLCIFLYLVTLLVKYNLMSLISSMVQCPSKWLVISLKASINIEHGDSLLVKPIIYMSSTSSAMSKISSSDILSISSYFWIYWLKFVANWSNSLGSTFGNVYLIRCE